MDSLYRLSEESFTELTSGTGFMRDEAKLEYLGPSPDTTSGSGGESELDLHHQLQNLNPDVSQRIKPPAAPPSRYESQKRRDWSSFGQYLKNHRPPITLEQCSGAHVIEFLRYLDQFGKTKVHVPACHYFGIPTPPHPCACPLRQAWGSLDALIGRLRAAFEESGGKANMNPFGARLIRLYLREVREKQAKARGIAYGKKKKGKTSLQSALVPTVNSPRGQALYENQMQFSQLHTSHQGHSDTSSTFSNNTTARSSVMPQAYTLDTYIPSTSPHNLVPRVYPTFEIHSFMEDMPSRDPNGWHWNPVCG